MADTSNLSSFLTDVANAIREKKGTEDQIPAIDFDTEIKSIETGVLTQEEYNNCANLTRQILGEFDTPSEIITSYDTYFLVGKEAVRTHDSETFMVVLGHKDPGYDTSSLLTFDLSKYVIDVNKISKVELYAYLFDNDIASRQQTHPVRSIILDWNKDTIIDNSYMNNTPEGVMVSLSTENNGYGWRHCDVTNLIKDWILHPENNRGLIIDNNRGQSNAGGVWAKMRYYTLEHNTLLAAKLVFTYV